MPTTKTRYHCNICWADFDTVDEAYECESYHTKIEIISIKFNKIVFVYDEFQYKIACTVTLKMNNDIKEMKTFLVKPTHGPDDGNFYLCEENDTTILEYFWSFREKLIHVSRGEKLQKYINNVIKPAIKNMIKEKELNDTFVLAYTNDTPN